MASDRLCRRRAPPIEECLALYRDRGDRAGIAAATVELGYLRYWQGERTEGRVLIEEGLAVQRELGLVTYASRSALLLGHIARQEGQYALARSRYAESMAGFLETKPSYGLFYDLAAFGCLAAAEGQFERAARLYGATERVGEAAGIVMVPYEHTWHDPAVAATRAGLGEEGFAAAWAAGRAMTSEEAVAYALEGTATCQVWKPPFSARKRGFLFPRNAPGAARAQPRNALLSRLADAGSVPGGTVGKARCPNGRRIREPR